MALFGVHGLVRSKSLDAADIVREAMLQHQLNACATPFPPIKFIFASISQFETTGHFLPLTRVFPRAHTPLELPFKGRRNRADLFPSGICYEVRRAP